MGTGLQARTSRSNVPEQSAKQNNVANETTNVSSSSSWNDLAGATCSAIINSSRQRMASKRTEDVNPDRLSFGQNLDEMRGRHNLTDPIQVGLKTVDSVKAMAGTAKELTNALGRSAELAIQEKRSSDTDPNNLSFKQNLNEATLTSGNLRVINPVRALAKGGEAVTTGVETVGIAASNISNLASSVAEQGKRASGTDSSNLTFSQNLNEASFSVGGFRVINPVRALAKGGEAIITGVETVGIAASSLSNSASLASKSAYRTIRNWWNGN